MISITSYYGDSAAAENNAKVVTVGSVKFYFSYETIVAVEGPGISIVSENAWGPTSGKHINEIDGGSREAKANRLSRDEFEKVISEIETLVPVTEFS